MAACSSANILCAISASGQSPNIIYDRTLLSFFNNSHFGDEDDFLRASSRSD